MLMANPLERNRLKSSSGCVTLRSIVMKTRISTAADQRQMVTAGEVQPSLPDWLSPNSRANMPRKKANVLGDLEKLLQEMREEIKELKAELKLLKGRMDKVFPVRRGRPPKTIRALLEALDTDKKKKKTKKAAKKRKVGRPRKGARKTTRKKTATKKRPRKVSKTKTAPRKR